jgi:Arc/MetJ-type ribon-helix-helix transcriptional regulator
MKKKISISIEENTITDIEDCLSEGYFRNKSHIVEFAVIKFIKENKK